VASEKKPGTALITGASGGIGLELAHVFAENGHDLVLVARSAQALETLAAELRATHGIRTRALPADLRRPDAPAAIESALADETIDVLVNNAGFGLLGAFAGTDLARERDMIQVNVTSLVDLTKRFLYPMVQRRRGRIVNVASTAAFQPGPLMSVYYASKAFVLHFSEALGSELEGTGVTVTALCPGPTTTGFQAAAGMGRVRLLRGPMLMDAASVARIGYRGLMEGRRIVIPGLLNALLAQSIRFTPRRLATAIVKRLQLERTAS
jgi:short-subunit dehydrogenase